MSDYLPQPKPDAINVMREVILPVLLTACFMLFWGGYFWVKRLLSHGASEQDSNPPTDEKTQ